MKFRRDYVETGCVWNFDDECDDHTGGRRTGSCAWFGVKESYACYDDRWTECSATPTLPSNTKEIGQETCKCSDGTLYGRCSETKPKKCENGVLIDKCSECPCPGGYECDDDDKECEVICADTSWIPDRNTVCSGQSFTQTSNCGTTRTATGTKSCVASLSISNFKITKTTKFWDGNCYYNRCYYQTTIKNSGNAGGVVATRKVYYGNTMTSSQNYNQLVSAGQSHTFPEKWIESGCITDYTYNIRYYDNSGNEIGRKSITCNHP